MKRAVLILAGFAYLLLLLDGISTGLGVYCSPTSCWAAAGCALVAFVCAPTGRRWICAAALVLAIGGSLHGYRHNEQWRAKLDRIRAHQTPPPSQTVTNK